MLLSPCLHTQGIVMARLQTTTQALTKIELEAKTTDLKLRLKGKIAVDLADYARAYGEAHGRVELEMIVAHMLGRSWTRIGDSRRGVGARLWSQPAHRHLLGPVRKLDFKA